MSRKQISREASGQHNACCNAMQSLIVCMYSHLLCMYGHTYTKSMDQPRKVANPARGQLNRENEKFSVRVRSLEFGLA